LFRRVSQLLFEQRESIRVRRFDDFPPPCGVRVVMLALNSCAEEEAAALVGREDGVDEIDRVERFGRERVSSVLSSSFSFVVDVIAQKTFCEGKKRNEM